MEESKELSCKEKMRENARKCKKNTKHLYSRIFEMKKIDLLKTVHTCLFADSYLAHTNLQELPTESYKVRYELNSVIQPHVYFKLDFLE